MIFVIQMLIEELEYRIQESQSNLQGTFECCINIVKGQVEAR